jgi:low affinity Fe/Cu permease
VKNADKDFIGIEHMPLEKLQELKEKIEEHAAHKAHSGEH